MKLKRSALIILLTTIMLLTVTMLCNNSVDATTNNIKVVAVETSKEQFEQEDKEYQESLTEYFAFITYFTIINDDTDEDLSVGGLGDFYYEAIELDRSIDYTKGNYAFYIKSNGYIGESFEIPCFGKFTYEGIKESSNEDVPDSHIYKSKITTNSFKRAEGEYIRLKITQTDSETNKECKFFLRVGFMGELSETESQIGEITATGDLVLQDNMYVYGVIGKTAQLKSYDYKNNTYSELPSNLVYTSSDESILSVTRTGKMTFNKAGEVTLKVENETGKIQELTVTAITMEEWLTDIVPDTSTKEDINEAIKEVEDNTIIAIEQEEVKTVETTVFEKLSTTKDSYLSLTANDAQWIFKSDDITNLDVALNPKVTVEEEKPEVIESDLAGDAMYVDFEHSGKLPGKAKVQIYIGEEKFGDEDKELNFYYFNETTKKYEDAGIAKYSFGYITVELEHCSKYAVTETKIAETELGKPEEDKKEEDKNKEDLKDDSPATGVESYVVIAGMLAVISLGIIVTLRKNENK